jgi:hypothetical protein
VSAIYWRDGSTVVRLSGAERAHMNLLIGDVFLAPFRLDGFDVRERLQRLFPPSHHVHRAPDFGWAVTASTSLKLGWDKLLLPDGTKVDPFTASLNTALVMGSDPFRLMARLHGQCELHAYVEGHNRSWLAGIIRQGLKVGLMRDGQGWDDVLNLLESADDRPVVTDYSACESFPNAQVAEWTGTENKWGKLSSDKRWQFALTGLRAKSKSAELELRPDTLGSVFGDSHTAFTILDAWDKSPAQYDTTPTNATHTSQEGR